MDKTNWVLSIATSVSAVSVVFIWLQTRLLRRQLEADHERSRREQTIALVQHWNRSLGPLSAAARTVVEALNDDQCRKLWLMQAVSVSDEYRPMLETCLADAIPADGLRAQADQIVLSPKQSARLRYLATNYLNETEAVLLAWSLSIADRELIESEFGFLCDDRSGTNALENYRKAAGGHDVYPAIQQFIDRLRAKRLAGPAVPRAPVVSPSAPTRRASL